MATRRKPVPALTSTVDGLFHRVVAILEQARSQAARSVNREMVVAYWLIGREIVEHKQSGRKRATYGEAVLEELSRRLSTEFGRGFDVTNLRKMRQFYRMFEIRDAPRLVSGAEAPRLPVSEALSWSHYRWNLAKAFPSSRGRGGCVSTTSTLKSCMLASDPSRWPI